MWACRHVNNRYLWVGRADDQSLKSISDRYMMAKRIEKIRIWSLHMADDHNQELIEIVSDYCDNGINILCYQAGLITFCGNKKKTFGPKGNNTYFLEKINFVESGNGRRTADMPANQCWRRRRWRCPRGLSLFSPTLETLPWGQIDRSDRPRANNGLKPSGGAEFLCWRRPTVVFYNLPCGGGARGCQVLLIKWPLFDQMSFLELFH